MSKFSGFYKIFAVSAVVVAAALFAAPVVFMSRAQEIDSSKVGDYRKKLEDYGIKFARFNFFKISIRFYF